MAGLAGQSPHHHSHIPAGDRAGHRPTHPHRLAHGAVCQHHPAVVHNFGFLSAAAVLLAGVPCPGVPPGAHRPRPDHHGGVCHRGIGQLAQLPLPAGHHRGGRSAATAMDVLHGITCIHSLRHYSRADLLRNHSLLFDQPSRPAHPASHHRDEPVRLPWRSPTWQACWRPSCTRSMSS